MAEQREYIEEQLQLIERLLTELDFIAKGMPKRVKLQPRYGAMRDAIERIRKKPESSAIEDNGWPKRCVICREVDEIGAETESGGVICVSCIGEIHHAYAELGVSQSQPGSESNPTD